MICPLITGPAVLAVLRMASFATLAVLVIVQFRTLPAAVAVVLRTSVAVVGVAKGVNVTLPAAVPVQVPDVANQPVGMVSVMVVVVAAAAKVCTAPETPVPAKVVLIV